MREAVIQHKEKDFSIAELEPVLATDFLKKVVKIGNLLARDYSLLHMEGVVKGIKVFGRFLATSSQISPVPGDLKMGIAPIDSKGNWFHFLNEFSHYILNNYSVHQVRKYISTMNMWLTHMADAMMCPAGLVVPNHLPESSKRPMSRRGSIVAAKLSEEAEKALDIALDSAKGEIKKLGLADEDSDLTNVVRGVLYDVINEFSEIEGMSSETLLVLIQSTLKRRLERIYVGANDRFKDALEKRKKGKRIVAEGLPYMPMINDWLDDTKTYRGRGVVNPNKERVDELTDDQFEAGIYAWCVHYHEFPGLHPYEKQTHHLIYGRLLRERKKRPSLDLSADTMIDCLGASRDLLVSGFLILTFETCGNASSLQNLEIDAMKNINQSVYVLDWIKDRAQAVLSKFDIRSDDKIGISTVFDSIIEATDNYRRIAIRRDMNSLFLHAYAASAYAKGREKEPGKFIVRPSSGWFNTQTKLLVNEVNNHDWTATAKDIRASILLSYALERGVKAAQDLAQHASPRTTIDYVSTPEMKLKYEEKIRAFQEWLQVLVTINVEDIHTKLDLAEDAYAEIEERIAKSRFGGAQCSEPLAGHQPGSEAGKPCTQIKMCMTCEKRMNLFVASEENVAHLLQWRDALNDAFQSGKISKSNINWTLWQMFVDTMHDRMASSAKHKGLLADVRNRIAENENPYHRVFARSA